MLLYKIYIQNQKKRVASLKKLTSDTAKEGSKKVKPDDYQYQIYTDLTDEEIDEYYQKNAKIKKRMARNKAEDDIIQNNVSEEELELMKKGLKSFNANSLVSSRSDKFQFVGIVGGAAGMLVLYLLVSTMVNKCKRKDIDYVAVPDHNVAL